MGIVKFILHGAVRGIHLHEAGCLGRYARADREALERTVPLPAT